jgi:AbrB family looped-hinge helix DNA binding protein
MAVKVSPKYQVVIPENVRKSLGIKVGTAVEVIAKGGVAYLVPVTSAESIQDLLDGKLDLKGLRDKRDRL